ncbi:MAG: ribonuclease R [Candidatus Puniceispirillum sp.]
MADKDDSGDDYITGLPKQQAIIDFVNSCATPPNQREIVRAFNIGQEYRAPLRRLLRSLSEQGLLVRREGRRIASPDHLPEVTVLELMSFDDNGDGMARVAGENSDDSTEPPEIRVVLSRKAGRAPSVGQTILARLARVGPNLYEARIIKVLERQQKRLFGEVIAAQKGFRLQPAERGKRDAINLQTSSSAPCAPGDLVEAELLPSKGYLTKTARVVRNLGSSAGTGAFSALAIAEFNIRHHFPEAVISEANALKTPPAKGRLDLRDTPLVTIDGADAKDFDDAVFAEPTDTGGWRLLIAIADVSHYVRQDSALDKEARTRGNSVYLPDMVVPMLPEAISNDLCSLRPHEDKAAMVAEIFIDSEGKRTSHSIQRALIKSHARLTYDKVQAVFDGTLDEADADVPHGILHALFGAWHALNIDRTAREPLALDLQERRVEFDDNNVAVGIALRKQTESQRLIEDFMIAANVAAADTLIAARRPCVFRVHDAPDPKKADSLHKLADAIGGKFARGQVLQPHHFNKLLAQVKDTADELMVNEAVLRSQSKAVYDINNIGHFGLSLRNYAHFTSPIRRYADLLVHRALVDHAAKGRKSPVDGLLDMPLEIMSEICTHISETEANAANAERRSIDRFAAALFEKRINETMEAVIVAITGFGAFLRLDDGKADGFLPLKNLPDDYYDLDASGQWLEGRHAGWTFGIGTELTVQIAEVNAVSGGILLRWVSGGLTDKRPNQNNRPAYKRGGNKTSPKGFKRSGSRKNKSHRRKSR